LDISVRQKVSNEKGKPDEIKYWFLVTRLATSLTTADGQVDLDPNFFELEKSGRSGKKVKKVLPKNYSGVGSKLLLKIELIEFPIEIFGPRNGLMGKLPTKKKLQIREMIIDFVGIEKSSEKRLKIGEHNGITWVLPPSLGNTNSENYCFYVKNIPIDQKFQKKIHKNCKIKSKKNSRKFQK